MIAGLLIPPPQISEISSYERFLLWVFNRNLLMNGLVIPHPNIPYSIIYPLSIHQQQSIQEVLFFSPTKEDFKSCCHLILSFSKTLTSLIMHGNDRITCPALKRLLKSVPHLTNLCVSDCKYIKTQILHTLPQLVPHLTSLNISKCILMPNDLVQAIAALPALRKLNVSYCSVPIQIVGNILKIRPTLEELIMDHMLGALQRNRLEMARSSVRFFAEQLSLYGSHLQVLSIQECTPLEDDHLLPWLQQAIFLRKLSIAGCLNLTDMTLYTLARYCPHLTALDVRNCHHVSDDGLIAVGIHTFSLCDIALDGCYQLSPVVIRELKASQQMKKTQINITFSQCYQIQTALGCSSI
jgi:hypothetical protein